MYYQHDKYKDYIIKLNYLNTVKQTYTFKQLVLLI